MNLTKDYAKRIMKDEDEEKMNAKQFFFNLRD